MIILLPSLNIHHIALLVDWVCTHVTYFGSGIWSYSLRITGAILSVTVPETTIRSAWRGLGAKGQFLQGWSGTLVCDGYAAYDQVMKPPGF